MATKSEAGVSELAVKEINLKAKNKEILSVADVVAKSIGFDILKTALNIATIDVNKPKFTSKLNNNGLSAINELGLGEEKPATTAKKLAKNDKKNREKRLKIKTVTKKQRK